MLFVLSPAKTLDMTPAPADVPATRPQLGAETARLAAVTRTLKAADLSRLMDISPDLATLNAARFKAFRPRKPELGLQAAFMFDGDVYTGLDARSLDLDQLAWAQDRLRILSGLYGLLRPLDRIQPYRLEMGTRLATERGANLYDFWGDRLSKALNREARGHPSRTLINLASQEYFGAVDLMALKIPVVTCRFKEERDETLRIISFFAKTARGLMARWAIERRIEAPEALKGFDTAGYRFRPYLWGKSDWVFVRPQP
jgi:cytoplasmic iron level regulating protein YaaA (DUF328/UPF0246 family)